MDADLPVHDMHPLTDVVRDSLAQQRFTMFLLMVFLNFIFDEEKKLHWLGHVERNDRVCRRLAGEPVVRLRDRELPGRLLDSEQRPVHEPEHRQQR